MTGHDNDSGIFSPIFKQFAVITALVIIAIITIFSYITYRSERQNIIKSTQIFVDSVSASLLNSLSIGDQLELERLLGGVVSLKGVRSVYVLNQEYEFEFAYPEKNLLYQKAPTTGTLLSFKMDHAEIQRDFQVATLKNTIVIRKILAKTGIPVFWSLVITYSQIDILYGVILHIGKFLLVAILIMASLYFLFRHNYKGKLKSITSVLEQVNLISKGIFELEDVQPPSKGKLYFFVRAFNEMKTNLNELRNRERLQAKRLHDEAALVAIGSSTAMVAHDVRKPMAGMKMLLTALPAIKDDPAQVERMISDVDRSIAQTNAMLNDVLDFSRDATALDLNSHDPQGVITSALGDALRNHAGSDVKIEYDLGHKHTLNVDGYRITRVLTNVIDNALDAMTGQDGKAVGRLWIRTEECADGQRDNVILSDCEGAKNLPSTIERGRSFSQRPQDDRTTGTNLARGRSFGQGPQDDKAIGQDDRCVRITIADSGPGIPEETLSKIFDPFFTHGKKGGTGLGLAICKRMIDMHGGKIEARNGNNEGRKGNVILSDCKEAKNLSSTIERGRSFGQGPQDDRTTDHYNRTTGQDDIIAGAEFTIELAADDTTANVNEAELINDSGELKVFRKEEAMRTEAGGDISNTLEFMRINKERGRISDLLVVDDEPLFRNSVRNLLKGFDQVRDHIKVVEVADAETALKLFSAQEFDYVVADIDLGKNRMNGYEFVQKVLKEHPNTHVIIHSNKRKEELDIQIRVIASVAKQSPEHSEVREIATSAKGGLAMTNCRRDDKSQVTSHACPPEVWRGSRFMGFLPKPMKASELLQFLACRTFEAPSPPATNPSAGRRPSPIKGEGVLKNLLLLNDDENFNVGMRLTLRSDTLQVKDVTNIDDALKHLAGGKFDVILSDINLGEGKPDGYEFLRLVKERKIETPFYFLSGYSKKTEWPKAEQLGANGFFQLPINIRELKDEVKL